MNRLTTGWRQSDPAIFNIRLRTNDTLQRSVAEREIFTEKTLPQLPSKPPTAMSRAVRCLFNLVTMLLLALPNAAQGNSGSSSLPSQLAVADCGQARDPARCLALQKARAACQAKRANARRQCLRASMPAPDCSMAPDPAACEVRRQARTVCRGKSGKELRGCLRSFAPKTR